MQESNADLYTVTARAAGTEEESVYAEPCADLGMGKGCFFPDFTLTWALIDWKSTLEYTECIWGLPKDRL